MIIKDMIDQSRKRVKMEAAKKTAKEVAIGVSIGAAVGMAAGTLLAPKSGKETREDIAKGAKHAAENVRDKVEEVKIKAKEEFADMKETKNKVEDVKSQAKKDVADIKEEAKSY